MYGRAGERRNEWVACPWWAWQVKETVGPAGVPLWWVGRSWWVRRVRAQRVELVGNFPGWAERLPAWVGMVPWA